jgi:hypothetical protein
MASSMADNSGLGEIEKVNGLIICVAVISQIVDPGSLYRTRNINPAPFVGVAKRDETTEPAGEDKIINNR